MKEFRDALNEAVLRHANAERVLQRGECRNPRGTICTICRASMLNYDDEVRLKNTSLQQFWKSLRLPCRLEELVISPLGRNYRTVTKRKAFDSRDGLKLGLIDTADEGHRAFEVGWCAIEPLSHARVYDVVREAIGRSTGVLAKALRYIVIKGNYDELTVIVTVDEISPTLLKAANALSKRMSKAVPEVVAVFLFEDRSDGRYYLGSGKPERRSALRKLFGKAEIFVRVRNRAFLFHPFAFSQVNLSLLDKMVATTRELLLPTDATLYDLYSGYGVFSLCLADRAKSVVGIELSPLAVNSAIENARRQKAGNVRFHRADITEESLSNLMKALSPKDCVLLDPPRNGTAEGVIELIASARPAQVLHVFCNIDIVKKELRRWIENGYRPVRAIPFDNFPGTDVVELLVLLEPANNS